MSIVDERERGESTNASINRKLLVLIFLVRLPNQNQKRENNGWKPRTLFPVPCCESIRGKRKEGRQARRNERVSTLRRNAESKMTLVEGDLHDNVKA